MTDQPKRTKRQIAARVNWVTYELLQKISVADAERKGEVPSIGRVIEESVAEYFRNHPEYWPEERKGG